MYKNLSIQMVATLAKLTRLKEDEGVLLALHPDFILIVRPGMGKTEREDAADALLTAAEGGSFASGDGGTSGRCGQQGQGWPAHSP